MSELNIFGLREYSRKDLFECTTDEIREADRFYIMHEADKVIAELKEQSHQHYERWFNLNKQYEGWLGKVQRCESAESQLRYNKYKRCLAMAKACEYRFMNLEKMINTDYRTKKMRLSQHWWAIWLKLAEKFKEAK